MLIFKDKYCRIDYSSDDQLIEIKWLKQPDTISLLRTYTRAIDLAIELKVTGWMADNSLGIHLDVEMQRALAELCARRMHETNVKRFARVVPMDVFQELVTNKVVELINELTCNKIEIEVFSTTSDAKAWVTQKNLSLADAC